MKWKRLLSCSEGSTKKFELLESCLSKKERQKQIKTHQHEKQHLKEILNCRKKGDSVTFWNHFLLWKWELRNFAIVLKCCKTQEKKRLKWREINLTGRREECDSVTHNKSTSKYQTTYSKFEIVELFEVGG